MLSIKSISARNFLSIGNVTQAIDFSEESLTLVLGVNADLGGESSGSRNGVGKSAILNALSYAIYGQALTNIRKDNLVNHINGKNMLVTVDFEKDGKSYRIERGRKPNVLKYYINNQAVETKPEDEGQGDSRETQKDIDQLVGLSHDMFKHIIALNTYSEPFLSMKAGDQRAIIEQLLGVTALSEKAECLKEQIKSTKDEILKETTKIDAVKKSNQRIQDSIDSLKLKQSMWQKKRKDDIASFESAIQQLNEVDIDKEIDMHRQLSDYIELAEKHKNLSKQKAMLESSVMQASKTANRYQQEIIRLNDKKCPSCDQQLHDHKHTEMLDTVNKNFNEADMYLCKLSQELTNILDEIKSTPELGTEPKTFYNTVNEAYNHKSNLENLSNQIKHKLQEQDIYQEQIVELENTALQDISWEAVNELTTVKEHQEFLLKLLTNKDSFIRKTIIDRNLAYLNSRLTYYLDQVGLPHTVVFQNDLSVEISILGQSLDFDNLSRGERNRLILGLSWSFRDVWESLYSSVNLMFIDELIDNGLDASGVESALSVLKKMCREGKRNIWLISHRDELQSRIPNILKVTKENGFTTYNHA